MLLHSSISSPGIELSITILREIAHIMDPTDFFVISDTPNPLIDLSGLHNFRKLTYFEAWKLIKGDCKKMRGLIECAYTTYITSHFFCFASYSFINRCPDLFLGSRPSFCEFRASIFVNRHFYTTYKPLSKFLGSSSVVKGSDGFRIHVFLFFLWLCTLLCVISVGTFWGYFFYQLSK